MRKLGIVKVCGIDYTVEQRSCAEDRALQENYGYCDADRNLIVLENTLTPSCFRNTLMHEVMHAIFGHSGLREMNEKADTDEETFIRVLVPHVLAALDSIGKWRSAK